MKILNTNEPKLDKNDAYYFGYRENCIRESGLDAKWEFAFPNGYNVSVVGNMDKFSRKAGLFQAVATKSDGEIVFDGVDFDCCQWQTAEGIRASLQQVANLPAIS